MRTAILAIAATGLLLAAIGTANAATPPVAPAHAAGANEDCTPEPYLSEIVCRAKQAVCALTCYSQALLQE